ncbi:uncharacterized protein PHACADRAFT_260445 [Phanerochaete carnosa HHB-10118-sp]|uniref:Uncharacterized protein n=1 Tax=Phanerochaete carnosa (strain HHB-10118-sp) TaxID=650164 RepID=K5VLC2_PHACS|nr:uncharacterized protein PHACADRAFT_260445 [Phanerochaete carnosa HHB-10118-sp]EKM52218.1 hypothetical protein PHACADRAFT_260445 [Phanerochaete carnosa HHB-10118-sp]
MQQSCSLLALTVEARNDNGSICPEAALERQPAAETLRASARDHYIPAVYAVMAPGVKRRPFPRRRIVLLVMHFALCTFISYIQQLPTINNLYQP